MVRPLALRRVRRARHRGPRGVRRARRRGRRRSPYQRPDEESPASRLLGGVAALLALAGMLLARIVEWYALVFMLFAAALGLVAGLDVTLTGNILIDLVLVAVILFGAVYGLMRALRAIGARRRSSEVGPPHAEWPFEAAGLVGGLLLVVVFLPRALSAADRSWFDVVFALVGAVMSLGTLRGWLRAERPRDASL